MSPEVSPLVAGCASAGLTTLLLQPLDLVKTRLQEDRGARVATVVRAIVAEGGVRALWTGVTPSLWRTVPGVGLYFWLYHQLAGGRGASWGAGGPGGPGRRVLVDQVDQGGGYRCMSHCSMVLQDYRTSTGLGN